MKKILIADDSLAQRTQLTLILTQAGHHVKAVSSGNEVIPTATSHQPELIMLDIIMSDGDGYRTCRQLKRSEATRDIPVLMVSSKSNEADRAWAFQLGAVGYITKPYTEEDILQAIDNL